MANPTAEKQLAGAFELFSKSQEIVKKNLKLFVILFAIPFLLDLGGSVYQRSNPIDQNNANSPPSFNFDVGDPINFGSVAVPFPLVIILALAAIFVSYTIYSMLIKLQLEGAKGKTPKFSQLWDTAKSNWLKVFGLFLVLGITIIAGLLLFIIPGIIFIRRYFLSPWVMLDQNTGIFEAMRESSRISKGYTGAIWGIIGVYILICLTTIAPIIGILIYYFLAVSYSVAPALRYYELKQAKKT